MKKILLFPLITLILGLMICPAHAEEKPRNIMLIFDLKDYSEQIDAVLDHFFQKALEQNDQLIIMTPARKLLSYSSRSLSESRKKIVREVKNTLQKQTSAAGADYRDIYNEMLRIVTQIQENPGFEGIKNLIAAYENYRRELPGTRNINQELLLNLAEIFKKSRKLTGETENRMYLFFQREYRPVPDNNTLNEMRENQLVAFQAARVFLEERSQEDFDAGKIAGQLNQADVTFNFIYISHKKTATQRYQVVDNSGDFYNAMEKIAALTGGDVLTTTQPKAVFTAASDFQ